MANVIDAFHYSIQFTGLLANADLQDLTVANIWLTATVDINVTKIRDGAGSEVQPITLGGPSAALSRDVSMAYQRDHGRSTPDLRGGHGDRRHVHRDLRRRDDGEHHHSTTAGTTAANILTMPEHHLRARPVHGRHIDVVNYPDPGAGTLASASLPLFVDHAGTGSAPAAAVVMPVRDGTGNEVQTLTLGTPAAFTPAFNSVPTAALTFTAGSSPTAAALCQPEFHPARRLAGSVTVLGPAAGPFLLVFSGGQSSS